MDNRPASRLNNPAMCDAFAKLMYEGRLTSGSGSSIEAMLYMADLTEFIDLYGQRLLILARMALANVERERRLDKPDG